MMPPRGDLLLNRSYIGASFMHDVSGYTRYERTVWARTSPATDVIATIGALVKVSTGEPGRSDDICRFPTRGPHRSIAGTAGRPAGNPRVGRRLCVLGCPTGPR